MSQPRGIRIQVTLTPAERVALNEETARILGAMRIGHDPDTLDALIARLSKQAWNKELATKLKGRRR
jgi:hypothetical protein